MFNIVLFQPQIPPNTGNIARLCVGTNSKLHIVRPIPFFLDNKSMRRAGCDYWDDLSLECHNSLEDLYKKASPGATFYYITKFGEKNYTDIEFKDGDYIVFGSETSGLPEEVRRDNKERTLKIPMPGPIRSHNLSNSAAIVLFEAIRQIS